MAASKKVLVVDDEPDALEYVKVVLEAEDFEVHTADGAEKGLEAAKQCMPDLMILVSTLGGLALFGAVGLIIGPVIAGLFITIWEIFRETFGGAVSETGEEISDTAPVRE